MGMCQSAPKDATGASDRSAGLKSLTSKTAKEATLSYGSHRSAGVDMEKSVELGKKGKLDLKSLKVELIEKGDLGANAVRMETPFGKPIEEVYDGVHDGKILGTGVSGTVRLITHKVTGMEYAVKCLDLGLIESEEGLERLRDEIYIMCQLDHPNIVRLEQVYESETEIYLVQELCMGGDLFDRLDAQEDYHYTEARCASLVKQMLSTLRYLHLKKITHRDLKLENFLFGTQEADSLLKMIDFGLSKHLESSGEALSECVGTPYSVAPEVISGSYNEKCDLWSIGVITYLLLCGETPFGGADGESLVTVRRNILSGKFEFEPEDIWDNVSGRAKDFVKTLLNVDPASRPSAREAQLHSWIQKWSSKDALEGKSLDPKVARALVKFKDLSCMRQMLSEVLSYTLMPDQIADLKKEFEKIDVNGDGQITVTELREVMMSNAETGSLGSLSEEEIDEIFKALLVNTSATSEPTIQWHEFLAASLSQCKVDDRNLRLAFGRLDADDKGYITLDDVMALGFSGCDQDSEDLEIMWKEALKEVGSSSDHITFEDFRFLMKGPPKQVMKKVSRKISRPPKEVMRKVSRKISTPVPPPAARRATTAPLHPTTPQPPRPPKRAESAVTTPLSEHRAMYHEYRSPRISVIEASHRVKEQKTHQPPPTLSAEKGTKEDNRFTRRASTHALDKRPRASEGLPSKPSIVPAH